MPQRNTDYYLLRLRQTKGPANVWYERRVGLQGLLVRERTLDRVTNGSEKAWSRD